MAKRGGKGGIEKGIALTVKAIRVTEEIFQGMLSDYLKNRTTPRGLTSLAKLEKSGVNLENIEITERNIGGFLGAARKYDINYALKRDKSTDPPTYYVFFETDDKSRGNITKAFAEYTNKQKETLDRQRVIQDELLKASKNDVEKEKPPFAREDFEERV